MCNTFSCFSAWSTLSIFRYDCTEIAILQAVRHITMLSYLVYTY